MLPLCRQVLRATSQIAICGVGLLARAQQPYSVVDPQTIPLYARAPDALPISLPPGQLLRLQITRTVNLRVGQHVEGTLIAPVYRANRLLIPVGSHVSGFISSTPPEERGKRLDAKLNGDFTPLRAPLLTIRTVELRSSHQVAVDATGGLRNSTVIRLTKRTRPSLAGQIHAAVHAQTEQVRHLIHEQHKSDRLQELLFSQLPYHPQRLWAGSQFDALLTATTTMAEDDAGPPMPVSPEDFSAGTVHARLSSSLTSKTAKKGEPVVASVTEPLLDSHQQVLLPEGTTLGGIIMQANPAKSFSRQGTLRFAFRTVTLPAGWRPASVGPSNRLNGTITAVDGAAGTSLSLDDESKVQGKPDTNRFLAPLILGAMVLSSQDEDGGVFKQGVTSNGFGLAARVLTMALGNRNLSTAFAAYGFSRSVYKRFLARGHDVEFPRNTELEVDLARH